MMNNKKKTVKKAVKRTRRVSKDTNPEMVVSFILDKSGSMSGLQDNVISGFSEYLQTLQHKDANVRFNLTLFDTDSIQRPYINTPLKNVKPLTRATYVPCAGTPLYDAVVDSVNSLFESVKSEQPRPSVVVVIMTDGMENASVKHDQKCMRDLVKQLEKEYNWTFVYMGANQDSYANAASFGIAQANTVNWGASAAGAKSAFAGVAMGSVAYMADVTASGGGGGAGYRSTSFFNAEVRKDIEKEVKK